MLGEKHFRPLLKAPWASSTQNPIRAKGAFPAQFRNGTHGSVALGTRRPNGPFRPSRTGVRLGEGRAPARPGFACPAPAIGCRVPAFIPYAHVLQPARLPFRAHSPQRTRPPQRKRPPLQARRRRPGTAPRTSSRTPPRAAAPPRDEIPVRNNLVRLPVPSPPARPTRPRRPPRICLCVPPQKGLRNPPRMRLRVPAAVREGATAHATARAVRRRRPRPGRGRRSPPPGGGASRAPCSA